LFDIEAYIFSLYFYSFNQYSFEGAGFSLAGTQSVLNSIASNCKVDDGEVTRAAEVFWIPGDPSETLTSRDIIVDFPELIDL
jgi:uncharacterized membrane protein